jgi:hypothetical protein
MTADGRFSQSSTRHLPVVYLALQLCFLFKLCALNVGETSFGLMGSAPERPGDDAGGLYASLDKLYGDTADQLSSRP